MRYVVLSLLLFITTCKYDQVTNIYECGRDCSLVDKRIANVGECHSGIVTCDSDGKKICVGWMGPTQEICDGLDNNCNNDIDDDVPPQICSTECGVGIANCLKGQWIDCSAPTPRLEICNRLDDDCNGAIDDIPIEFCYDGPPGTLSWGLCHPGVHRCADGRKVCWGQQLPTVEICNGLDDDCNGKIDENTQAADDIDIVVVFDDSCSMATLAPSLKYATRSWATKYATATGRREALVTAPDSDESRWGVNPHLYQDFTDAVTFSAAIGQQAAGGGSYNEPTLDALNQLLSPINPLGLSWRPGVPRLILVFSDEHPQSYSNPPSSIALIVDQLKQLGSAAPAIHIFTSTWDASCVQKWGQIATAGSGALWDIKASESQLEFFLDQVIATSACVKTP